LRRSQASKVSSHDASQAVIAGASRSPESAGMSILVVMVGEDVAIREEERTGGRAVVFGKREVTVGLVLSTDLARRWRGAWRGSKRGRALVAVVLRVKWGGGSSFKEKDKGGIRENDECGKRDSCQVSDGKNELG
jgi:hypothetical protein